MCFPSGNSTTLTKEQLGNKVEEVNVVLVPGRDQINLKAFQLLVFKREILYFSKMRRHS